MPNLNHLKRRIVELATVSGEAHIPSALSILDILWVLYDKILKIDPKNPGSPSRDRFILSKGQAGLGLYAVLAEKGFFTQEQLESYCKYDSLFGGHPDRNKVPGVEASTGSLGHGFPMAVGVAMALKIKKNPARAYVLIGDGEANEGSVWEAVLLGAHHRLDNLTCIVDYNHSTDRALLLGSLKNKFAAFDWEVAEIDGHDQEQIFNALSRRGQDKPLAIIANTTKGLGIKMMENNPAWHHKMPSKEELKAILEELK